MNDFEKLCEWMGWEKGYRRFLISEDVEAAVGSLSPNRQRIIWRLTPAGAEDVLSKMQHEVTGPNPYTVTIYVPHVHNFRRACEAIDDDYCTAVRDAAIAYMKESGHG